MYYESISHIDSFLNFNTENERGYYWKAMNFYQLKLWECVIKELKTCLKINK